MSECPKILLIGAGRFGKNHLRVLKKLDSQGKIILVDVITSSNKHKLTNTLLKSVDAVDIVTPIKTHYALVKKCIGYCHVFVEKPLAVNFKQSKILETLAEKNKKILMVGHIYRYHPVICKLKELIKNIDLNNSRITGRFISPKENYRGDLPALEKLHFFDVVDFLCGQEPMVIWSKSKHYTQLVDLRYKRDLSASFLLGWMGNKKERFISVDTPTLRYDCDLSVGKLTIHNKINYKERVFKLKMIPDPLERELEAFVNKLHNIKISIPDGDVGARMVKIAETTADISKKNKKPKIAIIGGGIFGVTTALNLSSFGKVTLFERHSDIMQEASRSNQYRHHMGYHYPRSVDTISEIKEATDDFEKFYNKSIIRSYPAYYAISKKESYTSAQDFLKMCHEMELPCIEEFPPVGFLNQETVDLCIRTPEAVIDYDYLKNDVSKRLSKNKNINICLNSEVTGIKLNPSGQKIISICKNNKESIQDFDIVINATYVNYNRFCNWLGFLKRDLEFRLKEIPIISLPKSLPLVAVMVIDGPFATLVPLGKTGLYTFGDAPVSIHTTGKGISILDKFEKKIENTESRWLEMKNRCQEWFPVLKNAEYVDSMFAILPVEKNNILNDDRPTEITDHGFGCYSILSGKIITAVTTANKIRDLL